MVLRIDIDNDSLQCVDNKQSDLREMPRVTDILSYYTGYERIPKRILKHAAERGTKVHEYCASILTDSYWGISEGDEECLPYIESFLKVSKKIRPQLIEERFYDNQNRFTGQIDIYHRTDIAEGVLIDLKTSQPQKHHVLQLAAYSELLDQTYTYPHSHGAIIYLDKTGEKPKVLMYSKPTLKYAFEIFLNAYECYKYFTGEPLCTL